MRELSLIALALVVAAGVPQGDAPALAFDVASVKPNRSGEPSTRFRLQPGGRLTAQNAPLQALITFCVRRSALSARWRARMAAV